MEKAPATRLKRNLALLQLAKDKAEDTRLHWRSADLGPWDSRNPSWRVIEGKILFQFSEDGRRASHFVASVRKKMWGLRIELIDGASPVPGVLDLVWDQKSFDSPDPRLLWKISKHWLSLRYPGCKVMRAIKRPDLANTISGSFLRVLFRQGGQDSLLLAAGTRLDDDAPRTIGQALLWLCSLSQFRVSTISAVCLLVPKGRSAVLSHRCRFLNERLVKAEVWEYGETESGDPQVRRAPDPPTAQEEKDFRWPVLGPFRWSAQLERVLELAPELIRRYPRFRDYDSLRLWGLEFAQVIGPERDRIVFGVGPQRTELTEENFDSLRSLVDEILFFRRADTPDIRHPYYRLQAERWLEALMLEGIAHLFPEMAPESVYSQIPVYLGQDNGRIDILGADQQGTLVVMELKVNPDPDLPIQALDYWGRVIQHNENGDFERRGYFSEVRLTRERPKIYLVSPVFSFHDKTESLLHYLDPDLEVWKIALNEDWRCGVKIVRRIQIDSR